MSDLDRKTKLEEANKLPKITSLFFLVFGLYLTVGAFYILFSGEWPIFMPPQLDFVVLLSSIFGDTFAAYFGTFIALALGGLLVWIGALTLFSKSSDVGQ